MSAAVGGKEHVKWEPELRRLGYWLWELPLVAMMDFSLHRDFFHLLHFKMLISET